MDPKLIGQQWTKFMKQQVSLLNNEASTDKKDNLASNPFYSKYADKLKNANLDQAKKQQLFNLSDEEKMVKQRLVELEKKLEKKKDENKSKVMDNSRTPLKTFKKLDEIIKLDLIKDLSKDEIKKIWFEYFKNKDATIFACLDDKNYDKIRENVKKYPTFVFLLPVNEIKEQTELNKNNYQFVLVQFQNTGKQSLQCCFTPLAFYHTHKENAPATLVINYHAEIKQDKAIVLMEGEYDNKIFNLLEAQCLTNQIQIFYSNQDKQQLLDNFTNNSSQFDYMDIVKEFEKSIKI